MHKSFYLFSLLESVCLIALMSCVFPATAAAGPSEETYRIAFPVGRSSIEFPLRNLQVQVADTKRPYYMFKDTQSGLNISFNFEPATKCNSGEQCRDYFATRLKKLYPAKTDWNMGQIDDVFISEDMEEFLIKGKSLRIHNMNAHLVKDGVWIDVHLSKVDYEEKDRQLFIDFIRSVAVR